VTSHREFSAALAAAALALVSVATPAAWALDDYEEIIQAQNEVAEESLLDVGIMLFDTGLPEDEYELFELEEKGIFADVRKSEARYLPIRLKQALESSGFWGAVRLVPDANIVDLTLAGTILESNGKKLEVQIMAFDSSGKRWIRKKYKEKANRLVYHEKESDREPFQNLYNRIANDLLEKRNKRDDEEIQTIRDLAKLRFAADLAPVAYADYVEIKKGGFGIEKLPALDDPMMTRLSRIRERDHMFIDTLNEYYSDFMVQMDTPYDSWRAFSFEEQVALDELRKADRIQKVLGIAAIIGGGVIASKSGSRTGRSVGEIAMLGGLAATMDSSKSEEMKMNREALRELAQSLDSEIAPLLIDVEGEVMRLSGSVATQYEQWRQLLRQIFAQETGFPLDPNLAVHTTEDPSP
jgi:hypothetical protein